MPYRRQSHGASDIHCITSDSESRQGPRDPTRETVLLGVSDWTNIGIATGAIGSLAKLHDYGYAQKTKGTSLRI